MNENYRRIFVPKIFYPYSITSIFFKLRYLNFIKLKYPLLIQAGRRINNNKIVLSSIPYSLSALSNRLGGVKNNF